MLLEPATGKVTGFFRTILRPVLGPHWPEQCEHKGKEHFCFLKFKRSEMNVNRQHFPAFELEQNTV